MPPEPAPQSIGHDGANDSAQETGAGNSHHKKGRSVRAEDVEGRDSTHDRAGHADNRPNHELENETQAGITRERARPRPARRWLLDPVDSGLR
jgi:hypothetical protein